MGILNNAQRSIVIPEPEGLPNSSGGSGGRTDSVIEDIKISQIILISSTLQK